MPDMSAHTDTSTALELLLTHCARDVDGIVDDPADVAAVVAVERLSARLETTDTETLRAALGTRDGIVPELVTIVEAALRRRALGWSTDAGVVNPEAGSHPVTSRAPLLRAAARAAHATFDAVPYYAQRFGERGARFAASDSSWLAGLSTTAPDQAVRQVTWLAGVLAARGMPSWLMERHLGELAHQIESDGHEPGSVPKAAAALRARRWPHADDAFLAEVEHEVAHRVSHTPTPRTGTLVAAAVGDVRSGLAHETSSLMQWLTDPARTGVDDALTLWSIHDDLLPPREGRR